MPLLTQPSKEFNEIFLTWKEKLIMLRLSICKKIQGNVRIEPYRQLFLYGFIKNNSYINPDDLMENYDGTMSVTDTYKRYCIYRREQFFKGKLPVIIAFLALMKSYGFGIDDIILWCMQRLKL